LIYYIAGSDRLRNSLTYSTLSVHNLTKVICKYLKPDGVFYEVLSDDRDVRDKPVDY
jgi:hypothetical protein